VPVPRFCALGLGDLVQDAGVHHRIQGLVGDKLDVLLLAEHHQRLLLPGIIDFNLLQHNFFQCLYHHLTRAQIREETKIVVVDDDETNQEW
jgi:hypothetical protein